MEPEGTTCNCLRNGLGDISNIFSASDRWNELDENTVMATSVNAFKINQSTIGY